MSKERFLEVHKLTAQFEGGWSNHAADPGGKTMYGVTEAVFHQWLASKGKPKRPVRSITHAEAEELYFNNYWLAAGCDKLPRGVDRMAYDVAVNSGVSRSKRHQALAKGTPAEMVRTMYQVRLKFLMGLKTWKTFGKGWKRRVDAMSDMALSETAKPVPVYGPEHDAPGPIVTPPKQSTVKPLAAGGVGAAIVVAFWQFSCSMPAWLIDILGYGLKCAK